MGSIIYEEGENEEEIKERIRKDSVCASVLIEILRSKTVSRKATLRIYITVINPIVLFENETWVIAKKTEIKLQVWERKILRRIFGERKIGDRWQRKTNEEIYELFEEPKITSVIKHKGYDGQGIFGEEKVAGWLKMC